MSAAAVAEMYRPATASAPTCGPSGRSTACCATAASRSSSAIRSACRCRNTATAAAMPVDSMMPSTLTMPDRPWLVSMVTNTIPTMVARPPTASTVGQNANTAARNGTAANSPMKPARSVSTASTAVTATSSTRAAPRPAREAGLSGRRPDGKLGMGTGNSMPDRGYRRHQLDRWSDVVLPGRYIALGQSAADPPSVGDSMSTWQLTCATA